MTYFVEGRANVPIYPFRALSPLSGSGTETTDGDGVKMIPRGFLDGVTGHKTIYEFPDLTTMVQGRLSSENINSEFFLWAANFGVSVFWELSL